MNTNKKAVNAGVDAILGFEFQRNCALFLLLQNYDEIKEKDFFICIEHHDDFLLCYRTNCRSYIEEIHSYQAKKKSGSIWTINQKFIETVAKILEAGNDLRQDPIPKSSNYSHKLSFISNTEIKLTYKPKKIEKENGKKEINHLLNEQRLSSQYNEIPSDIREHLEQKVSEFCSKESITYHSDEFDNFNIEWVDLPRDKKRQKYILIGVIKENFSNISDAAAAVDLLLNLFREVESVYNQGKIVKLLDSSKRVEGEVVKQAINVINNEQKTFDLWRNHSKELSKELNIPIGIQNRHENYILDTFELLKDMKNHEHQIIKDYVKNNDYSMLYCSHEEIFKRYTEDITRSKNINLDKINIFFAVLCTYVEYHGRYLK
ncbi:DUF4297 domain-containing protein [Larsenimonas salina]|uniref:DUF4297 domain-containing protein n=1 Tax=Larsenimonas salina TaxID=1295565 RepID=UPI0020738DB2|nr:DUF4297 domain-containing protein [Larsenimonas salina]MCM5704843.1 DUF4297 domain-containing protein [Larsenimonas salina]